jgi:hypothetical protein
MNVRYITVDSWARIYEVVKMFDRNAHQTFDPALASTCVINVQGQFFEQDADDVPIYTVH